MCGVSLLEMYSNTYFFKGWTDRLSSWVYESPGYSSRRERSRRRERQEGRREGEEELKKAWPGCVSRESREM